jgi:hypothetical protein
MQRFLMSLSAVALVSGFIAAPNASAQQAIGFYIGGFTPRALDARPDNDVLVQNGTFLSTADELRGIDIGEFNNVALGAEWLFGLTPLVEGGLGIGFYQKSVPTVYTDLVHPNGTEIEQTLKLRIIPFTATIRLVPLGLDRGFQPYIGAGVGAFRWRYSETGEFVDLQNNIFNGNFVGSGGAAGPVVLGGLRGQVESIGFGFEIRYQAAEADLPADQGFAGSVIDVGGFDYLFTMSFRF